ncbi:histidinol dehydrogenase [Desulfotomaculum arcticum]|uniref:Histidinol dehydrogenase n=1 Tax=Desulfotruncus arcticus DSM 17038 TaxID=1121424 RepID=A0A1I2N5M9_9FIRM|nr:histidinol dehydrogenase [Desulfotruncus arcticus]SFF96711.1 histidinol dehydrogenase [Desulfotomaculum arcticum] [Desulfotruncus arcticus DSM 17038]
MIRVIKPRDDGLSEILANRALDLEQVDEQVKEIIKTVRTGGDDGLCAVTARLDGVEIVPGDLLVSQAEIKEAYQAVNKEFLSALRQAAENIKNFHRRQLRNSWFEPRPEGVTLGQLITPLHRVGIYVPGGKASYPSSVLMNALPATVAGVKEIVMVTPPGKDGSVNPYTLVAASEAGIAEIYRVGGAQAIAALAYGTETIPGVEKITGPGNIYVTAAKRQVFGTVDIDMLAGPSEVLIIADGAARPDFVAADMLAQAEHDEMASAILVTNDTKLAEMVKNELAQQIVKISRREIAEKSIIERGAIIITEAMENCIQIANAYAPEHLELQVLEPYRWLGGIRNAGAVFIGAFSPEPVGDYFAGPNHVLPTGGTAKFFSPLNVDTFMKKTSLIDYSMQALCTDGRQIMALAATEGLDAHAKAVGIRLEQRETGQGQDGGSLK